MAFESLLGNERLKENLSAAIAPGHISHFYLISGRFRQAYLGKASCPGVAVYLFP